MVAVRDRVYITATGKFFPGEPVCNDEIEDRLGRVGGLPSRLRERILQQNRIQRRYYAIDENQRSVYSNAQMAAHAARDAVARSGLTLKDIPLLVAATSQGDLPLPGFASMVHGELDMPPCEIATLHGICASSVAALALYATTLIRDHKFLGLVNNRHPIISESVLGAAHRLMLHGLAVEVLHAYLVKCKRKLAAASVGV